MAAPVTTGRIDPSGIAIPEIALEDGYSSKIAFAIDPDVALFEKTVTPPAIDGGDPIDTTTMFNVTWRTFLPRALKTLDEVTLTCAYDPVCYTQLLSLININGSITVEFADGTTLDFWGFMRRFEPQQLVEGTHPEANVTIRPSNWDSALNVEAGPALTETAGT